MRRSISRILIPCGALFLTSARALAACPEATPLRNEVGTHWLNCRSPSAMAFAVDDPETTSTGTQPILCDAYDGVRCFGENSPGDGLLTVEADWATPGMVGCPVDPGGQRRVMVALSDSFGVPPLGGGSGGAALASIAGWDALGPGFYAIDLAYPLLPGGGGIDDLRCTTTVVAESTQAGFVNLRFTLPVIHSDCDPGSAGQGVGDPSICADGFAPTIQPGPVYKLIQPCNQPVDIRRSAWTPTGVTPDAEGRARIYVGSPLACRWAGSTLIVNGHETPMILGYAYANTDCLSQIDSDGDGYSPCELDCNESDASINPGATEVCDGRDNNCDARVDEDLQGEDSDGDGRHNLCDNCPLASNPDQRDLDTDGQGDRCDADDGMIVVEVPSPTSVAWQQEPSFDSFNVYRGDLAVLRATGAYTQDPQSTPLAARYCGVTGATTFDPPPPAGNAVFYLVTGIAGGVEGSLGDASNATPRPNANPCP